MKSMDLVANFSVFSQKGLSFIRVIISSFLLMLTTDLYASDRYFICGPDEDGCFDDMRQYCACIPYNDLEANNPYCIDFNETYLKCIPLSKAPHCHPSWVFRNQGECLATLFQSEPTPPCKITTHLECLEGHSPICNPDGELGSCH